MPAALASADRSGAEPWFVGLEPASDAMLATLAAPTLSLGQAGSEVLPAFLRAAALAGPHLSLTIAAPPEHPAHALAAGQTGLNLIRLPHPPRPAVVPRATLPISVVVPLYNHGAFIDQRLASILSQMRAPCEIIIIDDASQDDSLARARSFAQTAPIPVRIIARGRNSGSPFASWEQGARLARGDLLWIAESDDVADPRLLERLAPFLEQDERVMLAYCQSAAIGRHGERLADDHLFYTDEIDAQRWEAPYLVPGETEIAEALAIKNTIHNVSAVLFRRRDLAEVAGAIIADRYCAQLRAPRGPRLDRLQPRTAEPDASPRCECDAGRRAQRAGIARGTRDSPLPLAPSRYSGLDGPRRLRAASARARLVAGTARHPGGRRCGATRSFVRIRPDYVGACEPGVVLEDLTDPANEIRRSARRKPRAHRPRRTSRCALRGAPAEVAGR